MSKDAITITPRFIDAPDPVFTVTFSPIAECRGHIVYLPPFEEEMNRCRAEVASQARRFAKAGYQCTLLDYFGTGESSGRLDHADAHIWGENINATVRFLREERDVPVALWGCRLGSLLALQQLADGDQEIAACLLWQPVVSGKTFLKQFFRQRAAAFVAQGLPGENTAAMRERLRSGEVVEVAGYPIAERLVTSIEELDLMGVRDLGGGRVFWMELVADEEASFSPRSIKAIAHLENCGAEVTSIPFSGNALWQLHERANCPDLVNKTPIDIL